MDKKPKKNPKYEGVKGKLATGFTKDKVEIISDKSLAKRKSEVFTRISAKGVFDLLSFEKEEESIYNMGTDQPNPFEQKDNMSIKTNSTVKTIQTSKTLTKMALEINEETDYLLLDLREPEFYEQYHIKDAISFPQALINRDKFLPIIMQYVSSRSHQLEKQREQVDHYLRPGREELDAPGYCSV